VLAIGSCGGWDWAITNERVGKMRQGTRSQLTVPLFRFRLENSTKRATERANIPRKERGKEARKRMKKVTHKRKID